MPARSTTGKSSGLARDASSQGYRPDFLGGAAGAYCLLRALEVFRARLGRLAGFSPVLLVIAVMTAVIVVWEAAEFTSDRVLGTHIQVGRGDTTMDVLLGVAGALFGLSVTSGAAAKPRESGNLKS